MPSTYYPISGGYILVARKLFDGQLMNKPPLYLKLWVWMLNKANWKDRDRLKRGELLTSIDEMRDAMSYMIGYRKIRPTKDEIRSAYEAFTKATMITTTKTTRGMIVTILNYEIYQNPKNYEAHNEAHDENTTKPTVTPQDTEKRVISNKTSSPEALRLSGLMADLILQNNPKHRKLSNGGRNSVVTSWSDHIEKLMRIDHQVPEDIEAVIRWCQSDDFWKGNILSGSTLRRQYDQLAVKMKSHVSNYPAQHATTLTKAELLELI